MPTVSLVDPAAPITADAVVVGVLKSAAGPRLVPGAKEVDGLFGRRLVAALSAVGATGRADEVVAIPTLGLAPFGVVIACGVGSDAKNAEALRRGVGAALRTAGRHAAVHVAIDGPIDALAEGALLGAYTFTAYKSEPAKVALRRITIAAEVSPSGRAELKRARTICDAVTRARDLVNTPPNDLFPETFAARAEQLAATEKLTVEILDAKALERGNYGGILAVGRGSARPPRLVRLTYRPGRPKTHVALVGKGITFDSGGLNIKTANMAWMKSDMGGAAAVIAATVAAASLRLPIAVTATVPMAENMPSGSSYRPSDVLTMRSGRTVEVADTDAEGRLILADAISRALEDKPDYLIEASTLTGAQLVALGPRVIGAMGQPHFRDRVVAAGNGAGEALWSMPLPDDLRTGLDSPVADLVNVPTDRWGGMLVAGHFLADFIPSDQAWVHLDIAGPAWNLGSAHGYTPKGGTGAAVRTIIATLSGLAEG